MVTNTDDCLVEKGLTRINNCDIIKGYKLKGKIIMKGVSLFASAGIGETYLSRIGVDIVVANELIPKRAELYRSLYPDCHMICGDITDKTVYDDIIEKAKGIEFA